jgi:hypothetical protein
MDSDVFTFDHIIQAITAVGVIYGIFASLSGRAVSLKNQSKISNLEVRVDGNLESLMRMAQAEGKAIEFKRATDENAAVSNAVAVERARSNQTPTPPIGTLP